MVSFIVILCSFKSGRVCVVLRGKHAGKKAIIVKGLDNYRSHPPLNLILSSLLGFEEGSSSHKFPHALVAGIEGHPRSITKSMSKKRRVRRSKIKPFIKCMNLNHVMPTRYQVDFDMKRMVSIDSIKGEARKSSKKVLKRFLQEHYAKQQIAKNTKKINAKQFFFKRLRF